MRRSLNERDRGFTLIELLVVVIIIGILAAIAIPVYMNQRRKAFQAAIKHDAQQIATAYYTWAADHPGETFPDVVYRWGVNDDWSNPGLINELGVKPTEGIRFHSFDLGAYYPATGYSPGQQFCIEIGHTGLNQGNITYLWNSAKGGLSTTGCSVP